MVIWRGNLLLGFGRFWKVPRVLIYFLVLYLYTYVHRNYSVWIEYTSQNYTLYRWVKKWAFKEGVFRGSREWKEIYLMLPSRWPRNLRSLRDANFRGSKFPHRRECSRSQIKMGRPVCVLRPTPADLISLRVILGNITLCEWSSHNIHRPTHCRHTSVHSSRQEVRRNLGGHNKIYIP